MILLLFIIFSGLKLLALDPEIKHASPQQALQIAEAKRLAGENLGVIGATLMDQCRRAQDVTQAIALAQWNMTHNPASSKAMITLLLPKLNGTKLLCEKAAIIRFILPHMNGMQLDGMGKIQFETWMEQNKKLSRLKDWQDLERFKSYISSQSYFESDIVNAPDTQSAIESAEILMKEHGTQLKDVLLSMECYMEKDLPIENVIGVANWMLKHPATEYPIVRILLEKIMQPATTVSVVGEYALYIYHHLLPRIVDMKGIQESDKTTMFVRWFDSNPYGYTTIEPSSWTILRHLKDALSRQTES